MVEAELSLTTGLPKKQKQQRIRPSVILLAICAALGGLCFGYDIGGAGGTFVMDGFKDHFGWTNSTSDSEIAFDKGMINGLFGIGAMLGALTNSIMADKLGRRMCLATSSTSFIIGASIQVASVSMQMMWGGRFVGGIGIGMLSMCVPVYIAEASPEHTRGQLSTLWQLTTTIGILLASACNLGLEQLDWGWRLSYGGNMIFAAILLVSTLALPESPRWLASKERYEELRAVLAQIRFEDEVESEFALLTAEAEEERALGVSTWRETFSSANNMRTRVLLGVGLQMFQQLCGINAVMFYAPDILKVFFTPRVALLGTFGLNTVNFLATFITIYAVDRYGRRRLLLVGGTTMFVALLTLCGLSIAQTSVPSDGSTPLGIAVTAVAAIFVISFAYSWGPVVWVVCSEMFPIRARAKATGLTTASNWIFTTIVGAVFPIAQMASLPACFGFFAFVIGVACVVTKLNLPETANLTILQIDTAFEMHRKGQDVGDSNIDSMASSAAKPADAGHSSVRASSSAATMPSARFDRRTGEYHYAVGTPSTKLEGDRV